MDVLDLPCKAKDSLSLLVFNSCLEIRSQGMELLSSYSLDPSIDQNIVSLSLVGKTEISIAKSVLDYCNSNDLNSASVCRLAWYTVSSYSHSSAFLVDE
jgi:hypothetical protein